MKDNLGEKLVALIISKRLWKCATEDNHDFGNHCQRCGI